MPCDKHKGVTYLSKCALSFREGGAPFNFHIRWHPYIYVYIYWKGKRWYWINNRSNKMKNIIIAAVTATIISAAIPQAEAKSSLNKAKSERSGNTRVTLVGGSRIHSVNRGLPRVIQHGTSNAGYKWGRATRIQQNCKRGGPNPKMAACR